MISMLTRIILAVIVLAASFTAIVAFAKEIQYIGPSARKATGNDGVFAKHDSCATTFQGSFMCTSEMIVKGGPASSAPNPGIFGEWVNPVFQASGDYYDYTDISGVTSGSSWYLNCKGWQNETVALKGLVIKTNEEDKVIFKLKRCDANLAVACCR